MTTQTKLKIIPGRGLTGKDIKNRLRNRTLEGQVFGGEHYTLDERMDEFQKMSKVEQVNAARQNAQEIKQLQRQMEDMTNKQKQRQQEQEIERKVQDRIKQLGKQQQNSNQ